VLENGRKIDASCNGVRRTPAQDAGRAAVFVLMCDDGDPNRFFRTYLFTDQAVAIEFLQDVGLLRSQVPCSTCGQAMAFTSDSSLREGFRWRCQRVAGMRCNQSVSIKHGSWFQRSNLTLLEFFFKSRTTS
jgi:hypothetical protein